jgi:hypothetical protein
MRLVSYNILDGGEGRADPLAEVIGAQNPDIVVLVEADDLEVVDRIAGRLKMDRVIVEGRRHGAAILCRGEIIESINHGLLHEEFSDCLLEARVVDERGQEWTVAAVHLQPHATEDDERRRERSSASRGRGGKSKPMAARYRGGRSASCWTAGIPTRWISSSRRRRGRAGLFQHDSRGRGLIMCLPTASSRRG